MDCLTLEMIYTSESHTPIVMMMCSLVIVLLFHRYALTYVIVPVLSREMDEFVEHWNTHSIRQTRYGACPGGIPEDLYDMPEQYGN